MEGIAEELVDYIKPLIDQTDGSMEQVKQAAAMGQLCYNVALLSDDGLEKRLDKTRESLQMDEVEFEEFQRSVLVPMIQRHREMFPHLHRRLASGTSLL
ncbi:hypothetical protein [Schlesneria paludicola]|uniref:hypothetical protein n=1 Tax=Schlesneria paludicola TaxID=360056 RepID=UPI0003008B82|nr:hypothetical protein [Schlesneria paludicola]